MTCVRYDCDVQHCIVLTKRREGRREPIDDGQLQAEAALSLRVETGSAICRYWCDAVDIKIPDEHRSFVVDRQQPAISDHLHQDSMPSAEVGKVCI